MKRLQFEFAAPHPARKWLFRATLVCLALTTLAGAGGVAQTALRLVEQESKVARAAGALRDAERVRNVRLAEVSVVPPYFKDASTYAQTMQFPLNGMLANVETAGNSDVRVTTLDITASTGLVRMLVEFSTQDALSQYLDRLASDTPFQGEWRLVKVTAAGSAAPGGVAELAWSRAIEGR